MTPELLLICQNIVQITDHPRSFSFFEDVGLDAVFSNCTAWSLQHPSGGLSYECHSELCHETSMRENGYGCEKGCIINYRLKRLFCKTDGTVINKSGSGLFVFYCTQKIQFESPDQCFFNCENTIGSIHITCESDRKANCDST